MGVGSRFKYHVSLEYDTNTHGHACISVHMIMYGTILK